VRPLHIHRLPSKASCEQKSQSRRERLGVGGFGGAEGHRTLRKHQPDSPDAGLLAQNNIYPDVEVIPVTTIDQAYQRVLHGQVNFRFITDHGSLSHSVATLRAIREVPDLLVAIEPE
jgi:hypothetical protein